MFLNKKISVFWVLLIVGILFFSLNLYCHNTYLKKVSIKIEDNPPVKTMEKLPVLQIKADSYNSPNTKQDDPNLIQTIRKFIEKPSTLPYNLSKPKARDFSLGQSPLVDRIFKKMTNGFFIECGAMDGEGRSNSLFLERDRNWNGLLIEGNYLNYKKLKARHRKAYSIPACSSIHPYPEKVNFNLDTNMGRVFQGADDFKWANEHHRKIQLSETQCFPLYSMLLAMNRTTVDYFSLDVEGNELDVLKTIPFDKVDIKVISVEILHGPGKRALKNFLVSKGYEEIEYLPGERIVDWDIMVQKKGLLV